MSPVTPGTLINPLDRTAYGTKYDEHLFEQYKLFVATAEKVSDRRQSTNTYFLTISSSILSLLGLLMSVLPNRKPLIVIPLAGAFVSVLWIFLLKSFKRLNGAKFGVILDLEPYLPANLFKEEWSRLTAHSGGHWRAFTDREILVPWLCILLNAVLAIFIWILPDSAPDKVQKLQLEQPVQIRLINPIATNPAPVPSAPEGARNRPKQVK